MKFTEKGLQALLAEDKPYDRLASNYKGMIVRVSKARGTTHRVIWQRVWRKGVSRKVRLGEFPKPLSLAQAALLRERCLEAVRVGRDPVELVTTYWRERLPAPAAEQPTGPTVKDVIEEFLTHHAEKERRRPEQARYLLEHNVVTAIGDKAAESIRKRDIVTMLDDIVARGAPVVANRVWAHLKQAFAVAADRDLIESIPTFPRKPPGGREQARDVTLTDEEIALLWHGLDALTPAGKRGKGISRPLALALKLQLVTAQRRGEIAAAKWADIREELRPVEGNTAPLKLYWWDIAATKNERPHVVPLSALAQRLLAELKEITGKSDHWLPSAKGKDAAVDRERTITRAAREVRDLLKMKEWTPHDLRRTARTGLARLGVLEEVAERVVNHVSGDRMVQVYNQHRYAEEMREALDKWGAHVESIICRPFTLPKQLEHLNREDAT